MIAKLHDKQFSHRVPGFYDDVAALSRQERQALNSLPWKEKEFRKTVGAPALCGEKGYTIVEQVWVRPTLELNGIWGGYTGEGAKTVIPSKAYAKFSTRLVPNQDPAKIAKLVERQIRKLLPKVRHAQIRGAQHWQAVGRALLASRFSRKRFMRSRTGFGKKGRVHPRRAARFPSSRRCTIRSKCLASCWDSDCPMRTRTRRTNISRWKIILAASSPSRSFTSSSRHSNVSKRSAELREKTLFCGLFLTFLLAFACQDGYSSPRSSGIRGTPTKVTT